MSLAAERGLINGFKDETFGPQRGITHAETVVLLNRAIKTAMNDPGTALQLDTRVAYSSGGKEVTIVIETQEGI